MNIQEFPARDTWNALCVRPQMDFSGLRERVSEIMERVRNNGDAALRHYALKFDGAAPTHIQVSPEALAASGAALTPALKDAIALAAANIRAFHTSQHREEPPVETMPGVTCWRKGVPIERVGLYIPGGTAPLFSTLLMLGLPALIAGCETIVLCTPANAQGEVHPAILYTAHLLGLTNVFQIGGAQAIAAMTYGTESVPRVDKLFGPGNQYVTMAKLIAQQSGVAIDMPAGPSEVLVVADASANPAFVAADLLSQAEHGHDSQVVLVSDDADLLHHTGKELDRQLAILPRRDFAAASLANSKFIRVRDMAEALAFSNVYAPEHLIIASDRAMELAAGIRNAGSVFLGHLTPESVGDYASGTNHTLPTAGSARAYSGVSLDSYLKQITFQQLDAVGLRGLGPSVVEMAEAESLSAHARAVSIRLVNLPTDDLIA
jgi:histidinol dehydrogenase